MKLGIAVVCAVLGLAPLSGNALAAGCAKGAVAGGVVGHVAGHHGVAGAAVGCAVGHHRAAKKAKQEAAQTHNAPAANAAAPSSNVAPAPR